MCIQHERIQIFYTLPSSSIPAFSIFFNMDLAYKLSQNEGGLDRQCAMGGAASGGRTLQRVQDASRALDEDLKRFWQDGCGQFQGSGSRFYKVSLISFQHVESWGEGTSMEDLSS